MQADLSARLSASDLQGVRKCPRDILCLAARPIVPTAGNSARRWLLIVVGDTE